MRLIIATLTVLAALSSVGAVGSFQQAGCPYLWEWASPACDNGDVYDGYWWRDTWVPGYPSVASWLRRGPAWFTGAAVRYAPGVMRATAAQNGLSLDGYLGGVALPNCGNQGLEVWLNPGTGWEGPYLAVDCARLGDLYGIVMTRGVAVEVGYDTAMQWGVIDRLEGVQVWLPEPVADLRTPDCTWEAVPYRDWWLHHLQYAPAWERRPLWSAEGGWRMR